MGTVYKGQYGGYSVKIDVTQFPVDGKLYIQPPHPDYVDEDSPLYFIKRNPDTETTNLKAQDISFNFGKETDNEDDIP